MSLPIATETFDLVAAPNLIDRVPDPAKLIVEVARVLRPAGYFVFADPFNWVKQPEWWDKCKNLDQLVTLLGNAGRAVDVAFDGLVYREIKDASGAYSEWSVAMVRARKRAE
jgi:SAM-dependent methyltransferase